VGTIDEVRGSVRSGGKRVNEGGEKQEAENE